MKNHNLKNSWRWSFALLGLGTCLHGAPEPSLHLPFDEITDGQLVIEGSRFSGLLEGKNDQSILVKSDLSKAAQSALVMSGDFSLDLNALKLVLKPNASMCFWVKLKQGIATGPHFYFPGITGKKQRNFDDFISFFGKGKAYGIVLEDSKGRATKCEFSNLNTNEWYHVALSINNDAEVLCYLNGRLLSKTPLAGGAKSEFSIKYFGVGYSKSQDQGRFGGLVDDFRFYDQAISEKDLESIIDQLL